MVGVINTVKFEAESKRKVNARSCRGTLCFVTCFLDFKGVRPSKFKHQQQQMKFPPSVPELSAPSFPLSEIGSCSHSVAFVHASKNELVLRVGWWAKASILL